MKIGMTVIIRLISGDDISNERSLIETLYLYLVFEKNVVYPLFCSPLGRCLIQLSMPPSLRSTYGEGGAAK